MKKVGLFFIGALILLILSAVLYHTKAGSIRPKSITPSVYQITPFPTKGSFVDGTDVVLYGVTGGVPIIMKMGPDGTLRWSKEISLSGISHVKATKFGTDYVLVVSKANDGFYFLKIDPANGSVSTSRKIECLSSPLPIDSVAVYDNKIYVSGAGNCAGSIQGSFVIWLNSDLTQYSGFSYTLSGIAFTTLFPTDSQVVAIGHMLDGSTNKVIKAEVDKTDGELSVLLYNPQVSTDKFYVQGAVKLSGDYYALIRKGGASNVYGLVNLTSGGANLFSNTELLSINISGSNLLVSGGDMSSPPPRALFSLINPTNLTPVSTYKRNSPSTFGVNGMPYSTGHVLIWSGSAFVGFADSNLNITGFPDWSSTTLTGSGYTFSAGSSSTHSSQWDGLNQSTSSVSLNSTDYQVTITNIYTYTPPSGGGGGGGGPIIIPPPPPPEEQPPQQPEQPTDDPASEEVTGTTPEGEQITITGEVPSEEARITDVEYIPPRQCPTPSTFRPQFGGVSYDVEPAGNTAGGLSLKQSRFATTLTITYSRPLNPKAKVFACTTARCTDITSLVTMDINRNSITVRIEDGGVLDGDGQVNGKVETKHFVYAVIPEEYRESGGCHTGGGTDYGLLFLFLLPVFALLRRLSFKAVLALLFLCLPAFAGMEQVNRHIKEGEYEEALLVLDKIIREKKLSEELAVLKSYLLLKTGQVKEAITFLEESLKLIPSDKLRLRLAYLYGIVEDLPRAWSTLRAVEKKDQDYHFVKGFLYYREGKFTRAKFSLSKVTPSSENYQEAQVYLAQIFMLEEDHFRFRAAVKKVEKGSEFFETVRDMEKSFEQRKRFNLSFSAGAEYDTNLLGVFELETRTRTWKYFTSAAATYSGERLRVLARAFLSSNEKSSSYNLNFYSLELEPKKDKISFPLRFDYITLGDKFYGSIEQAGLAYRSLYGTPYLMVGYQDYLSPVFDFENRDGNFLTAGYKYEYITSRFYYNADIYVKSTNTKGVNWDSDAIGERIFGSYSFSDRLSIGLNFIAEGVQYRKENQAFLKKRKDFFVSSSPFLSLNLYKNFGLIASYTYARNLSSIRYYSYERNLYTLQLTGRF